MSTQADPGDVHISEIIKKEFWYMLQIGCTYGFTHTRTWKVVTTCQYLIVYSICISVWLVMGYTCYKVSDNTALLSQALHIFIIGMVGMTASIVLSSSRRRVERFKQLFQDPRMCEYADCDYFDELYKLTNQKKNRLVITWALIYGTCGLAAMAQPLIDKFFGGAYNQSQINGAWVNLPSVMWFPIDLENSLATWSLAYLLQVLYLLFLASMVTSATVVCFATCDRILDQLRLAIFSVGQLDERARKLFKSKYPGGNVKHMKNEYDECYYSCIIQNVKHHLEILKLFEDLMNLASYPIAVPFYGGAVLLGMALITITVDDDPRIGPKCLAALLASAEAYNMYLLCVCGQEFKDKSILYFESLMYTSWYARSKRCALALRLARHGSVRPLQLTAAKMLVLDMELFADLVNSAYSIFNLKAVSKES